MPFPRLRRKRIGRIAGTAGALYFVWLPCGLELPPLKPSLDMPVSLALGTVRSPGFPVKRAKYMIILRAEDGHMPFPKLNCIMGGGFVPQDLFPCINESVLEADWTVRDGPAVVAQGSIPLHSGYFNRSEFFDRGLGQFTGEPKKHYVLEVTFTKDASPLNVTNPHLRVQMLR